MARALTFALLFSLSLSLGCGDDGGTGDTGGMDGSLGGEGDACGTVADCQSPLDCVMNVCTANDGSLGDRCVYTESCMDGLFCSLGRTCETAGSGGETDACTTTADCMRPLVCATFGGSLRCVAAGSGDIGDPCESVDECRAGLFCADGACAAEPGGASDAGVDASDAARDTTPPPPPPTCLAYCGLIIGNCTDGNTQYGSFADCMAHCGTTGGWADGERMDTSGNSIACRTTYAESSGVDADANCAAAGPSGGNRCGTWCEVYCTQAETNCSGDDAIAFDPDCATNCADYPADAPAISVMGDSVQCRIYHSGAPAGMDSAFHCPHASPEGGAVCFDPPIP